MAKKRPYENAYRASTESEPNTETSETGPDETDETPEAASPDSSPQSTDWQKRYSDLQSYTARQFNEQKQKIDALTEQLNLQTTKGFKVPKSDEELDAWKQQFPDVYDAILTIAYKAAEEERKPLMKDVEALKQTKRELEEGTALAKVVSAHKDFYELKVDPAFHEWAQAQAAWVRKALYDETNWDADACIDAIDLYKTRKKNAEPKPRKKDDASALVRTKAGGAPNVDGGGKRIYTLSEIAKMKPWDFEKAEADIDLARKEGRIVQA